MCVYMYVCVCMQIYICNTSEWDRKGEEKTKLKIKNVSLFIVERFHLLKWKVFFYLVNCFFFLYIILNVN